MASVADGAGTVAGERSDALVRAWLFAVAFLVFAIVVVGGATRLTESGLSITEWELVTGVLPPLSHEAWMAEFDKYRRIPQYAALHRGMSLGEFQTIYLWEWGHRLLGRLIGAAMALPFFAFLLAGRLDRGLALRLFGVSLLVGLQGAIGWWMVSSGLEVRIRVAPYRLATHLTIALLIFAALWWIALGLGRLRRRAVAPRIAATASALVALLLVQTFLGGLVAGTRSGWVYTTWPLMEGGLWPSGMMAMSPWWVNLFENTGTVQFVHRMTAYAIVALAVWHWFDCCRSGDAATLRGATLVLVTIVVQALIGVATVLSVVQLHVALAHQAMIVVLVAAALWHRRTMTPGAQARA